MFQIDQAANKPDEYRAAILAYYAKEWPAADESKNVQVACLLLWDLLCAAAVAEAKDAFTELSQTSYVIHNQFNLFERGVHNLTVLSRPLMRCTALPFKHRLTPRSAILLRRLAPFFSLVVFHFLKKKIKKKMCVEVRSTLLFISMTSSDTS